MDKVYKVFISSPSRGLEEVRRRLFHAILEIGMMPIGMELFPADHRRSLEHIRNTLRSCDYCVVITAGRYGTMVEGKDYSYTEAEYDMAGEFGIPVVGFPHKTPKSCPSGEEDKRADTFQKKRLQAFNGRLREKQTSWWRDASDLCPLVQRSLEHLRKTSPREGWSRPSAAIGVLRKIVCHYQGDLIKYAVQANASHDLLVKRLRKLTKNGRPQENISLTRSASSALSQICGELQDVVDDGLLHAATAAYNFIEDYYKSFRMTDVPRICLKLINDASSGEIYAHSRNSISSHRYDMKQKIFENTAYLYIKEHEDAFLCNDMVKDALAGTYINQRLNSDTIKKYTYKDLAESDSLWKSCWEYGNDGDMLSYYRSTMVVPLTLANNGLENRFWSHLCKRIAGISQREKYPPRELRGKVFGYLGFDSQHCGFFSRNEDIPMGYCLADFLCMYLFLYNYYTHFSPEYSRAQYLLASGQNGKAGIS